MVAMMGSGATQKGRRKGPWTLEEDTLLNECIRLHGEGSWTSVAKFAGLNRNGKSCRLRWVNYLKPGLKKGKLTPQEEGIIYELHCVLGNKWSTIAKYLPGRTDNDIKNYWRTQALKKRKQEQQLEQQSQGCDMKNISCGEDSKIETKQTEPQENKQLMASIYSIMEDQCLPLMVHQEILSSCPDIMGDEDILVNLWDLDEPQGHYADYLGHSSKYVTQNQAAFGGGSNKLAIQDQDRVCCFQ